MRRFGGAHQLKRPLFSVFLSPHNANSFSKDSTSQWPVCPARRRFSLGKVDRDSGCPRSTSTTSLRVPPVRREVLPRVVSQLAIMAGNFNRG